MLQEPLVILANGDFPFHPVPLGILKDAQTIICCDGAVNKLFEKDMEPHYILGDMDSINENLKKKYRERMIELPSQDENDLQKATIWAENNGADKAIILGATGNRDDHNLTNIFTFLEFPTQLETTLYTNYGIFSIAENEQTFDSFTGQQVSIFTLDGEIKITSDNLKYNLNNKRLINLYCGSLNESLDKYFTLRISHGRILVYQTFA